MPDFYATVLGSATAGLVARFICHPIDTIKSRLQAGQAVGIRSLDVREFRALYRGLGAVLVGGVPGVCIYMTSYEMAKSYLSQQPLFVDSSFLTYFTAGMIAETMCCTIFVPVDVIKERLQVQVTSKDSMMTMKNGPQLHHYQGSLDALLQISRTEGLRGIYKGYGATLLSYGPFSALYFFLYEEIKQRALNSLSTDKTGRKDTLPFSHTLGCAALAGSTASAITNPLDLAKVRLQVEVRSSLEHASSATTHKHHHTLWYILHKVYRQEGFAGWWRGAFARVLFHTPSTAITMALFEGSKQWWNDQLYGSKSVIAR